MNILGGRGNRRTSVLTDERFNCPAEIFWRRCATAPLPLIAAWGCTRSVPGNHRDRLGNVRHHTRPCGRRERESVPGAAPASGVAEAPSVPSPGDSPIEPVTSRRIFGRIGGHPARCLFQRDRRNGNRQRLDDTRYIHRRRWLCHRFGDHGLLTRYRQQIGMDHLGLEVGRTPSSRPWQSAMAGPAKMPNTASSVASAMPVVAYSMSAGLAPASSRYP